MQTGREWLHMHAVPLRKAASLNPKRIRAFEGHYYLAMLCRPGWILTLTCEERHCGGRQGICLLAYTAFQIRRQVSAAEDLPSRITLPAKTLELLDDGLVKTTCPLPQTTASPQGARRFLPDCTTSHPRYVVEKYFARMRPESPCVPALFGSRAEWLKLHLDDRQMSAEPSIRA